MRYPPLTVGEITRRLQIDLITGVCIWKDATKHHRHLVGRVAGGPRAKVNGKTYWVIRLNGCAYRRAQLILTVATGRWPADLVDHADGDSLNDRATNLRHATVLQNAWNHKGRAKKASLPMGVRTLPSGRFQARLCVNKKMIHLGSHETADAASAAYQKARKENYGAFC